MPRPSKIQAEFVERISRIPFDVRAEVVAAEMTEAGTDFESMRIFFDGQFERAYNRDIQKAELFESEGRGEEQIGLHITRDSIYDMLPEGVTHSLRNERTDKSVEKMVKNHKAQEKEEEAARRFFNPLENEFFCYKVQQESLEKQMLFKLNCSLSGDLFLKFWGLTEEADQLLASKMTRLLPYAHRVVGDLDRTAYCLGYLLNEKVEINQSGSREKIRGEETNLTGTAKLGYDLVSGSSFTDHSFYLEFKIGPLNNEDPTEYIHEGRCIKFIQTFYQYFLPLEIEAKTTIVLPDEVYGCSLTREKAPILGFTSAL